MSLVHHVSAVEGVDRERDPDTFSIRSARTVRSRRLSLTVSFDPLPLTDELLLKIPTVGAYEVSPTRRFVQVVIGIVTCILASGIVFGFAALKTIFVNEGVYRNLCTPEEVEDDVRVCYLQDLRLNLAFNLASIIANVSALLVGALLDRYGPRFCGMVGSTILLFGSLCLAFAADLPFDGYMTGQLVLSLGGTFLFVPAFHLANAFPRFQGLILALVTGAFDSSAAIFLGFRIIYQATNGAFGPKSFFLIYLIVPLSSLIAQYFVMPDKSYETRAELRHDLEVAKNPTTDVHDSDEDLDEAEIFRVRSERAEGRRNTVTEIRELIGGKQQRSEMEKKEMHKHEVSGVWGALHGLPASQQIRSPWFILITLLTVFQMSRMTYFIATIWSQYAYMFDSQEQATQINNFFDMALPIAGVVTVPFIGILLDGTSTAFVLGLLVAISTAFGVLGVIPALPPAYVCVIFFCLFRPLYYSAMSDYAAKVFGFATFGTVYGTIICIAGLCTLSQSGLQAIVHTVFHDDPTPLNLIMTGLGLLVGIILVAFVAIGGKHVRQEIAEEDERRALLPHPAVRELPTLEEGRAYDTF